MLFCLKDAIRVDIVRVRTCTVWGRAMRVFFLALFVVVFPNVTLAQVCKFTQRAWVQGGPEVREFLCPVDGEKGKEDLRVSFLRLNEGIAGNLTLAEATPELRGFFGEYSILKNKVFEAAETLFRRFGNKQVY